MARRAGFPRIAAALLLVGGAPSCTAAESAPDGGAAPLDASSDPPTELDGSAAADAGADSLQEDADAGADGADAAPLSVSASVRANPDMVVAAYVDVTAPGASLVTVRHGDDTSYAYATPPAAVDAQGNATVVVLGLLPGGTTHLEVDAQATDGRTGSTGDLTFDAPALPPSAGLPASYAVTVDDGTATGFVLATWSSPTADHAIMLDRRGRVMWYRHIAGDVGPAAFERLPNGHFIVAQPATADFEELGLAGDVVRTWGVPPAISDQGLDGHEFLMLPDGHAAVLGVQYHAFDSTPYFPGGSTNATRIDNTLIDVDPVSGARVIWSTYPDVSPDELTTDPAFPVDPALPEMCHGNAVTLAPDGNLLLSCRALSQILKIDRATGAVLWRLGGKRSDFAFENDILGGFTLQHDPRFSTGGDLRVYDNGNLHNPQATRVVDFALDEVAKTATRTWDYGHVPAFYCPVGGSGRDLPNGRILVDFMRDGVGVEVDAQGVVHWQLHGLQSRSYRMLFAPTLYP